MSFPFPTIKVRGRNLVGLPLLAPYQFESCITSDIRMQQFKLEIISKMYLFQMSLSTPSPNSNTSSHSQKFEETILNGGGSDSLKVNGITVLPLKNTSPSPPPPPMVPTATQQVCLLFFAKILQISFGNAS